MAQSQDGQRTDRRNAAGAASRAADGAQQLIVNAQYIKDLSFENPRAPQSLTQQTAAPAVEINVDVKAQNLGPDTYEVVLTINASAKVEAETAVPDRAGLRRGRDGAQRAAGPALAPIVLVETPRLMFPFARNIIAETTRDGGFPPLMINPIDFAELLRREQAAAAPARRRRRPR